MYSYETNIMCDGFNGNDCPEKAIVTGEPGPMEFSIHSAEIEAERHGWLQIGEDWHCPDCFVKLAITLPPGHSGEQQPQIAENVPLPSDQTKP